MDVIVIGAGLGGLLAAVQFLQRGQRVVVLERLAHPGGRFTAKTFQGAQVSTGAVHMLPFGSNGELAGMLRTLAVSHHIHDAEVFGSFHVRGRQYVCHSLLQLASVLGPRQFAEFVWLGSAMFLRAPRADERMQTYRAWLDRRITRNTSPELYAFFERICHFALSVDLDDVTYPEIVAITKNMLRYGPPGIVEGGCAALTGELERRVLADGGELRLQQDVLAIAQRDGVVTGVCVRDRQSGSESLLHAPLVISNIGPEATQRLLRTPSPTGDVADSGDAVPPTHDDAEAAAWPTAPTGKREASGLKVHLLSDESIIPHRGIMYCLDTERIAGIVQPSNSDPSLAPPGKHLLITHQLMRSNDVNIEREAARTDLRRLFGDRFGTSVRILTMSQYRGEWPVNRAVQGIDAVPETQVDGLYLVGDAVKPSGYLMVEGVAQSVNSLLDRLDAPTPVQHVASPVGASVGSAVGSTAGGRHTPAPPPARRALHWLIAPPPPHPGA